MELPSGQELSYGWRGKISKEITLFWSALNIDIFPLAPQTYQTRPAVLLVPLWPGQNPPTWQQLLCIYWQVEGFLAVVNRNVVSWIDRLPLFIVCSLQSPRGTKVPFIKVTRFGVVWMCLRNDRVQHKAALSSLQLFIKGGLVTLLSDSMVSISFTW